MYLWQLKNSLHPTKMFGRTKRCTAKAVVKMNGIYQLI